MPNVVVLFGGGAFGWYLGHENEALRNEISALKTQMSEMNKNMSELMAANRLLMEQLTKQKNENVGNFREA
jgi:isopentenyl phosphate kinase